MTETATKNVFILDEKFDFPHLKRQRRIWAYLPEGYHQSEARYPVIYMHDGQNLFDELNAFGREWEVDETLDKKNGQVIVIGIDNGEEHRMAEYMLHDHPEHGEGSGGLYLRDIAEVLKPFIDSLLRTIPDRENTYIAGSSMGGLISFYAGIYFPQVFGGVGIFSPALWIDAPKIFTEAKEIAEKNAFRQKWYFYAGAMESETMVGEVAAMVTLFREYDNYDVTYQIDGGGIHDEAVWKNYFPFFYDWIIGRKSADKIEAVSHIKL